MIVYKKLASVLVGNGVSAGVGQLPGGAARGRDAQARAGGGGEGRAVKAGAGAGAGRSPQFASLSARDRTRQCSDSECKFPDRQHGRSSTAQHARASPSHHSLTGTTLHTR